MCSRYELKGTREEITERFDLEEIPAFASLPELRPTDRALIISQSGQATTAIWGLPAPWDGRPLINARGETLQEKLSFRPVQDRRCLVPASAYFEWRNDGQRKRKNRISGQEELFAFAGLTDGPHFTIITCQASPEIAHIHDRMPVMLRKISESQWLNPALPFAAVAPLFTTRVSGLKAEEEQIVERQLDLFTKSM